MKHSICLVCVKIVYRVFQLMCLVALPILWLLTVLAWIGTQFVDAVLFNEEAK